MFRFPRETLISFFLFLFSLLIFTRSLEMHGLEYRDDEIFYYKSTQEMLRSGNFFSPTYFEENRFQKPILFYWLILLSYKIFGVNWFAARFVAAFFGSLSVCVTWLMARELFRCRQIAHLSALILTTTPLFFRHAKNAVPDMPLNFFIVGAMYCAILFAKNPQKKKYSILFFVSCALGFMIKGPAAVIVPFFSLLVYALLHRKGDVLRAMRFGRGLSITAVFICPWFLYMMATHGSAYTEYMLIEETRNRLLGQGSGQALGEHAGTFISHAGFYVRTVLSYFAPWSLLFFCAIPLAWAGPLRQRLDGPQRWLPIWFGVVFLFFSSMHFVINHYMLVLTTPFAILLSFFLVSEGKEEAVSGKIWRLSEKFLIALIITAGTLAFSFLFVFLVGASRWWIVPFGVLCGGMIFFVLRSPRPMAAPLMLGIFLLGIFSQSSLLGKGGITAHAALQRFAAVIQEKADPGFVVGVGSHDIHEKEFQVYFEGKVEKVATSRDEETQIRLLNLFTTSPKVYCLITERDFKRYLNEEEIRPFDIVQEGYIVRKRMHIDKGFFIALFKGDQKTVRDYFMEKLILVKKDRHA